MSGMAEWEAIDFSAIGAFFDGFRPTGMPEPVAGIEGSGWRGIHRETQIIQPRPAISGKPSQPTLYGRYAFDHEGARGTVEGSDAPYRFGTVSTALRLELGADEHWVRGPGGVFHQLRQRMVDQSSQSFAIFPEGLVQRMGQDGDFALYVLRSRFTSTLQEAP